MTEDKPTVVPSTMEPESLATEMSIGPTRPTVEHVNALVDAFHAEHARNLELEAKVATLERAAQRSSFDPTVAELQETLFRMGRENATWRRHYPNPRKIPLASIIKLIPKGTISPQALHKWCYSGKVDAELRDGRWYVAKSSFEAHWTARGFPPLPL